MIDQDTNPLAPDQKSQPTSDFDLQSLEKNEPTTQSGEAVLPVVPIREGVLFPSTESVLTFGREKSVKAILKAKDFKDLVVLLTQRRQEIDDPEQKDLYTIGTLAKVERTLDADGQINALVRGIGRIKILEFVPDNSQLMAKVVRLRSIYIKDEETQALVAHLQKTFRKAVNIGKPVEFLNFMKLMSGVNDGELIDQIASTLTISTSEKQDILETIDIKNRLKLVISHLTKEMKILEIEKDVANKTQESFEKHMREGVLRERMRTIQKELGEVDDEEEVMNEYEQRLDKLKAPTDIRSRLKKEIKRLRQMSVNNPETGYIRSWIDTMLEIPWEKTDHVQMALPKAEKILNKNHYGLEKVKDRILEYIAVLQLNQQQPKPAATEKNKKKIPSYSLPTILCFVGPPGVGKTSIGRSIAEALGRKFVKVSLGGIRDEAEIRGHRRTYVGAMPGRIINGIKQAGTMNPVFMLDEVDKIGNDFRGDPSAALLEALDPEQNYQFEDHYLDTPFDLSQVIFITTANTLDTIPSALRDRLEIIRYSGYTQEEKFNIARRHLLKKVIAVNGLGDYDITLSDTLIKYLIEHYTQEAGVRSLERTLSKVMRKTAKLLLTDPTLEKTRKVIITKKMIQDFLGPEIFDVTLTEKKNQVGLATGLAWTSVGGDVLFIEVALTPGKGKIQLTGKLGDVMKESAQAALTYVKANAQKWGIPIKKIDNSDIHIHVPEGAVPKDGPSAGITITTAIISAFTKRPINRLVAMTGEVTLRGRVLRIGGLKEKAIAAHRAGTKMIVIPAENERDLVDIPDSVKADIKFKPAKTMDEVLKYTLL